MMNRKSMKARPALIAAFKAGLSDREIERRGIAAVGSIKRWCEVDEEIREAREARDVARAARPTCPTCGARIAKPSVDDVEEIPW